MTITLNNKEKVLEGYSEISVSELFKIMNFSFPMIIVKINGQIVKKPDYKKTLIYEGDNVSAFHLISGG